MEGEQEVDIDIIEKNSIRRWMEPVCQSVQLGQKTESAGDPLQVNFIVQMAPY